MSAFDDYKKDFQAELGSIIKERINAVDWTKKKLNEHRQQALTNMLNHADTHSKWHHEKLKGIDLNSITPDNLSALPMMTKEDVQANFDDISTDPKVTKAWCDGHFKVGNFYTDGSYCILASGGSSGHRAMQVYNPKAAAEFAAQVLRMGLRLAMREGKEPAQKSLAFVAAAPGAAHATSVIPPLLPGFTSEHAMAVTEPMVEIAAKLNKLQPKALTIYSSYLRHLIQAQEDGLLNISPESISLTSETPNPVDIARAKEVWACSIASNWGSIEFGTIGLSSGFEEGHLLSDDGLIIEALDENGGAILPGQKAAKLLITNLYNTTIPLIRYEFTDQLTIYDRPAVCGSNFRTASLVDGRLDEHFIYAGKTRVHVHLFRHVLEQRLGILEYQVRQTPNGADVDLLIAVNYRVDTNEIESLLKADLEKLGISNALVRVQIVESIKRTSAQKLKRFFPVH